MRRRSCFYQGLSTESAYLHLNGWKFLCKEDEFTQQVQIPTGWDLKETIHDGEGIPQSWLYNVTKTAFYRHQVQFCKQNHRWHTFLASSKNTPTKPKVVWKAIMSMGQIWLSHQGTANMHTPLWSLLPPPRSYDHSRGRFFNLTMAKLVKNHTGISVWPPQTNIRCPTITAQPPFRLWTVDPFWDRSNPSTYSSRKSFFAMPTTTVSCTRCCKFLLMLIRHRKLYIYTSVLCIYFCSLYIVLPSYSISGISFATSGRYSLNPV